MFIYSERSRWLTRGLHLEIEDLCPLPPIVEQSSASAVVKDAPTVPTSSGLSPTTRSDYSTCYIVSITALPSLISCAVGKAPETVVEIQEVTKEPLATVRINAIQPGAGKPPGPPPTIPLPPLPVGRGHTLAKRSGKENSDARNGPTTSRYTKLQPGAGRPLDDVSEKPPTANRKKAQPSAGSPSQVSALSNRRKSMIPGPRASPPSVAKRTVVGDGKSPKGTPIDRPLVMNAYCFHPALDVKAASRPLGGSETRTKLPQTVHGGPTAPSRAPSESMGESFGTHRTGMFLMGATINTSQERTRS